jgi:hypothetical protein
VRLPLQPPEEGFSLSSFEVRNAILFVVVFVRIGRVKARVESP